MSCSRKNSCELFPLISINGALKIWQSFYCDGNYQTCVRYQLGLEGKSIPATLLPNGKNLDLGVAAGLSNSDSDDTEESADYSVTDEASSAGESEMKVNGQTSNYYLRMRIDDSEGLYDKIAGVLKECGITVEMTMEKELQSDNEGKSAVFLTDFISEESINGALNRLEKLEGVKYRPVCIMLEKSG